LIETNIASAKENLAISKKKHYLPLEDEAKGYTSG
jgi:hypothetical protein